MKNFFRMMMCAILFALLQACSREPKIENGHLVTMEPHSYTNTLYYSGTVQPQRTWVVPCPVDGVVVDMPFQYGESVHAGQQLFMISSAKFLADYKTALMQYIKAKSDFNTGQTQLNESEFLHKNQLISDDEYKSKKSGFYASQLALLQAKDTLETLLRQMDVKDVNLYKLTIEEVDKITQAMHLQKNTENLRILSPANGIALSPMKNDDDTKKILKGDSVKQGDLLALIGDMSGMSVRVKVNELTINQLHVGQKVKITGIAFPDAILNGAISRVDRQGESMSGGLPSFAVEVTAPLALAQQKMIHAGMSANVEIDINENPQMMIPINAIIEKNGISYVKIYDTAAKGFRDVSVQTGKTTENAVAILAGLKAGDRFVVPDQA